MRSAARTLAATTLLTCCAGPSLAEIGDFYSTRPNVLVGDTPKPIDPLNPAAGWDWHSPPWTYRNRDLPKDTVMAPDTFITFGLENEFKPRMTKEFWIEFDYTGGSPKMTNANWGIHPAYGVNKGGGTNDLSDDGSHFRFSITTTPQPDWEWMVISNVGSTDMTINNFKMDHRCYPTPASVSLLSVGLLIALRRTR